MRTVVYKSVQLPAPAEDLFRMYMDPREHAAITGAPVVIGGTPGSPFRAFGGALEGTMLHVVRPRLIVQSWRSSPFRIEDPDSTLIICFTEQGKEGRIDLVHLDVPDHDLEGVRTGWEERYFAPWRAYLKRHP